MAKLLKDDFVNRAVLKVVLTAANTITFGAWNLGVSAAENVAIIAEELWIYPSQATLRELVTAADDLNMAFTLSDNLTGLLDYTKAAMIAGKSITGIGVGTEPIETPFRIPLSNFSGKGLILPATNLFFGMNTAGFAAPAVVMVVLFYRLIQIDAAKAGELLRMLFPANI